MTQASVGADNKNIAFNYFSVSSVVDQCVNNLIVFFNSYIKMLLSARPMETLKGEVQCTADFLVCNQSHLTVIELF